MKVVIILSGGIDSTTLLYDLINQGYDVYALGFAYGQKHIKECYYANKTCEKLGIPYYKTGLHSFAKSAITEKELKIPEGHYEEKTMKQTVHPLRNLLMLVFAASYAISIKAKKVFYGAHAGDHAIYPDCRPEFIEAAKKAIKLADYAEIEIEAPYMNMKKEDIIKRGLELGVDYSLTTSCYVGKEKACGKCGTCIERLEAFKKNNVKDPIKYEGGK
ncbi:MAG: 7-cyano-7-deazaguanine synthase QueC [Candidatus Heimdallarchaeaceae archaeon]